MMKSTDFATKARWVAQGYKTSYVWGSFGHVANSANLQKLLNQYTKNSSYAADAKKIIGNGFYFDCVGLIKGILWGFAANPNKVYGGAVYAANGVPDKDANAMFSSCSGKSADFSHIEVGEAVWMQGHIGIYIGDGLCVEATPAFRNGVQITAVANIGAKKAYPSRRWTQHGKLPYVSYPPKTNAELTDDALSVLFNKKIITDKALWKKKATEDVNIFYLIQKVANYVK